MMALPNPNFFSQENSAAKVPQNGIPSRSRLHQPHRSKKLSTQVFIRQTRALISVKAALEQADFTTFQGGVLLLQLQKQLMNTYTAYLTPNTRISTPKYTQAKVPGTQDKHAQLNSFVELCYHPIKSLAAASLPEYVDTHSPPTGYLRP